MFCKYNCASVIVWLQILLVFFFIFLFIFYLIIHIGVVVAEVSGTFNIVCKIISHLSMPCYIVHTNSITLIYC